MVRDYQSLDSGWSAGFIATSQSFYAEMPGRVYEQH